MKKYYIMAINQHLWNIALNLQSIQGEFYQLFFLHRSINQAFSRPGVG